MPLVAHTNLPTFDRLRQGGYDILSLERAMSQDIRELHIGLLNMMPDAALTVTEQQYMRLVGNCNQIAQFYIHPFSVSGLPRSPEADTYIGTYYGDFDDLREAGLDALIISGANVTQPSLELEPFWAPLREVIEWATDNVTSILCSCLATHALVKQLYQIDRHPLPSKQWGVYSHRVRNRSHPLLQGINTRFDVPHSRWNEVTRDDLTAADLRVLVDSDEAGDSAGAKLRGHGWEHLRPDAEGGDWNDEWRDGSGNRAENRSPDLIPIRLGNQPRRHHNFPDIKSEAAGWRIRTVLWWSCHRFSMGLVRMAAEAEGATASRSGSC